MLFNIPKRAKLFLGFFGVCSMKVCCVKIARAQRYGLSKHIKLTVESQALHTWRAADKIP